MIERINDEGPVVELLLNWRYPTARLVRDEKDGQRVMVAEFAPAYGEPPTARALIFATPRTPILQLVARFVVACETFQPVVVEDPSAKEDHPGVPHLHYYVESNDTSYILDFSGTIAVRPGGYSEPTTTRIGCPLLCVEDTYAAVVRNFKDECDIHAANQKGTTDAADPSV